MLASGPRIIGLLGLALAAGLALRWSGPLAGNIAHLRLLACAWGQPDAAPACQPMSAPPVTANSAADSARRARFLGLAEDWSAIVADYEALGRPSSDPLYVFQVGMAHYNLGELSEAVSLWQTLPATAVYWTHVCSAHFNAGQWAPALQACEIALGIDPANAWAHAELGRVRLYGFDDPAGALEAFEEAGRLGEDRETTWRAWAHALERRGRAVEAAAMLDAHQIAGGLADTIRGNALREQGRFAEAVAMYERALAQNSRDPWTWHALARAYLELRDPDAARLAWMEALALAPDFQPALDGLASLHGE